MTLDSAERRPGGRGGRRPTPRPRGPGRAKRLRERGWACSAWRVTSTAASPPARSDRATSRPNRGRRPGRRTRRALDVVTLRSGPARVPKAPRGTGFERGVEGGPHETAPRTARFAALGPSPACSDWCPCCCARTSSSCCRSAFRCSGLTKSLFAKSLRLMMPRAVAHPVKAAPAGRGARSRRTRPTSPGRRPRCARRPGRRPARPPADGGSCLAEPGEPVVGNCPALRSTGVSNSYDRRRLDARRLGRLRRTSCAPRPSRAACSSSSSWASTCHPRCSTATDHLTRSSPVLDQAAPAPNTAEGTTLAIATYCCGAGPAHQPAGRAAPNPDRDDPLAVGPNFSRSRPRQGPLALPPHRRPQPLRARHLRERHHPGQLAADRLLAGTAGRRADEAEAGAARAQFHAVLLPLDADRGARRLSGPAPARRLIGTADGLAKQAYFRESRRIRAEFTVSSSTSLAARGRRVRPARRQRRDRRLSHRPSPLTGGARISTQLVPFQIPLGALIPRGWRTCSRQQEPRHHAHHQRLLPVAPGRVEHRRGGRPSRGVLRRAAARSRAPCTRARTPPPSSSASSRRRGVELAWPPEIVKSHLTRSDCCTPLRGNTLPRTPVPLNRR